MKNKEIFVFGSNTQGRHGKGAALHAKKYHGAIQGQPQGIQGFSYAIITKELRENEQPVNLIDIELQIYSFIHFANEHPELTFNVTPIGCGLAGFNPKDIAGIFYTFTIPDNIILPKEFTKFKP